MQCFRIQLYPAQKGNYEKHFTSFEKLYVRTVLLISTKRSLTDHMHSGFFFFHLSLKIPMVWAQCAAYGMLSLPKFMQSHRACA